MQSPELVFRTSDRNLSNHTLIHQRRIAKSDGVVFTHPCDCEKPDDWLAFCFK